MVYIFSYILYYVSNHSYLEKKHPSFIITHIREINGGLRK